MDSEPSETGRKLWQAMQAVKARRSFPQGSLIFQKGERPHGIFFIEQGEVKLLLEKSKTSQASAGKNVRVLELLGPGAILGLGENVSGEAYRVTAKAARETTVSYVPRRILMKYLSGSCELCLEIVQVLSEDLHSLYQKFRFLETASRKHPKFPPGTM